MKINALQCAKRLNSAPALGFAANAQAGIAMTADAVDESEFHVTARDVGLTFFRAVIPDRSHFTSRADQKETSRGLTGDIQRSLLNELTLTHARRPQASIFVHSTECHVDILFVVVIWMQQE